LSRLSCVFWRRFYCALKYRPSNINPDLTFFLLPNNGLNRVQGDLVILGGEGRGNNSFQMILVAKKNQRRLWEILSIHWPSYCCLIRPPPIAMGGLKFISDSHWIEKICPSGGSIGRRFGVDSESASDLSCRIRVSEMVEHWEKVQRTSARPHVDLVPGRNGTGTRLTRADT
jgi:hypothetical protein